MSDSTKCERIEHFRLIEEIGSGSFSSVHKAYDEKLERHVALKVLTPSIQNEETVGRFKRESVIAARLDDPNVVRVFESGVTNNRYYIAFELVDGVTLSEWIEFTEPDHVQICRIMFQIVRGVAAAHEVGIVHRDLKPANVIVDLTGIPKVTDFGLASLPDHKMTTQNISLGTVAYMSPEQAKGNSNESTARSDIFSIGVIFFEAITSHLPIQAVTHAEYLASLATREITPIREVDRSVPVDLGAIIDKCLSREPRYRYENASTLLSDLEGFINGRPTLARPLSNSTKVLRYLRRHRLFVFLFLFVTAVLVGSTGISILYSFKAERSRRLQAVTANNALDAVVNGICNARPSQLIMTIEKTRIVSNEIKTRLQEKSEIVGDPKQAFNSQIAIILLYADSNAEFQSIFHDVRNLGVDEFRAFISAAKTLSAHQVESAANLQRNRERVCGRTSLVSLVAGTGEQGSKAAAIDANQIERDILIDAVVELDGMEELLQSLFDRGYSNEILSCVLIGVGEWQSELNPPLVQQIVGVIDSNDFGLRAAAQYVAEKHGSLKHESTSQDVDVLESLQLIPIHDSNGEPFEIMSTELTHNHIQVIANRPDVAEILRRMAGRKAGRGGVEIARPITGLTSNEISTICNAMSEEAGLQPVYAKDMDATEGASGFRLAKIEEWKCATSCRSSTEFFFGDQVSSLKKYGVVISAFLGSAEILPSRQRRPNPFGLFDVYGNAAEAVHDVDGTIVVVGGSSWATAEQCSPKFLTDFSPSITFGIRLTRNLSKKGESDDMETDRK